jgi:hypothetical protein
MAEGRARIGGDERYVPGARSQMYARSYIDGLERDRRRLLQFEQEHNNVVWEAVQMGAYNRALFQSLAQLMEGIKFGHLRNELLDRIEVLLQEARPLYESIYECECGHSKYDHDERGCQFLGCVSICGTGYHERSRA